MLVLLSEVLDELLRLTKNLATAAEEADLKSDCLMYFVQTTGVSLAVTALERRFAAPAQPPSKEEPKS